MGFGRSLDGAPSPPTHTPTAKTLPAWAFHRSAAPPKPAGASSCLGVQPLCPPAPWALCSPCSLCPHCKFVCVSHVPQCPRHLTPERSQGGSASITASPGTGPLHMLLLCLRAPSPLTPTSCLGISVSGQPLPSPHTPTTALLIKGLPLSWVLGHGRPCPLVGRPSVALSNQTPCLRNDLSTNCSPSDYPLRACTGVCLSTSWQSRCSVQTCVWTGCVQAPRPQPRHLHVRIPPPRILATATRGPPRPLFTHGAVTWGGGGTLFPLSSLSWSLTFCLSLSLSLSASPALRAPVSVSLPGFLSLSLALSLWPARSLHLPLSLSPSCSLSSSVQRRPDPGGAARPRRSGPASTQFTA